MAKKVKVKRKPKTLWTHPDLKGQFFMGRYAKVKIKGRGKTSRALVLQKVSGGKSREITLESHQLAKETGWSND